MGSFETWSEIPHEIARSLTRTFADEFVSKVSENEQAFELRTKNNLLKWMRTFLPGHSVKPPSKMHEWLGNEVDSFRNSRGRKLNVLAPRGAAKSTIGTLAYPLREALEGRERYIWIVSDTMSQAHSHLENIKNEIGENPLIAKAYRESAGQGPVWRAGSIVLRNGVAIEAYGTGQRLRGRRRREHRPSLIVCDDLQNDNHIISAVARDRSRSWFHGTLLKVGNNDTNIINLATALHREAIALELRELPGWTSKVFRALEEFPLGTHMWEKWESIYTNIDNPMHEDDARTYYERNRNSMDEGAVLLWPEHEDLYSLMKMRCESGRTAFEREKQNSPVNPEHCEWPEEYFEESIWFEDFPANTLARAITLDPSKGRDSQRGDYSAFIMIAVDRDGCFYVDSDLARRPVPEIVSAGVECYLKFRPDIFAIETNQFQDLLREDFSRAFSGAGFPSVEPYPLENRINKKVRIRRLGPLLSTRRIRFKSGSGSNKILVHQLKSFPVGDHDDGPDALEMAVRVIDMLLEPGLRDGR